MTLAPERIGDKGQRYEIRCFGYPEEGEKNVIGWAKSLDAAQKMARPLMHAPGASRAWVVDRENNFKVRWTVTDDGVEEASYPYVESEGEGEGDSDGDNGTE